MCGIYGFAGFDEDGLLEKMGRVIRHRGPDGEGEYEAPAGVRFRMGMPTSTQLDGLLTLTT